MKELVLVIGGSDSSGGAGIQADIKTITAQGAYASSIITSITSQNTLGVQDIFDLPKNVISSQIDSVISDLDIEVVKIGMMNNIDVIEYIQKTFVNKKLVIDPVMVSTSGDILVSEKVMNSIKNSLFANAEIITPNIPEAEILSNSKIDGVESQLSAARALLEYGPKYVLLKGGHKNDNLITDVLISKTDEKIFQHERVDTENNHGTGCTLASSIAAKIAQNKKMKVAVEESINYVVQLLEVSPKVGSGNGPLVHCIKLT